MEQKDVVLSADAPKTLLNSLHVSYLQRWNTKATDYEATLTEYLKMSGLYWCITALEVLRAGVPPMSDEEREAYNRTGSIPASPSDSSSSAAPTEDGGAGGAVPTPMKRGEILAFIEQCHVKGRGFSAAPQHDPHLLYTLSAIQILVTLNALRDEHADSAVAFVQALQQPDGSFVGDQWGEKDTRFSFCALACLALLKRLDAVDVRKAGEYILTCMNFDGGFGVVPMSETHAGQIYCCVGALAIAGMLHRVDADLLGWWLCERQLASGGFNGRPEKLPDVCYSWWVLSSLTVIGRIHWIDRDKLIAFICACQDNETGGFADRPGDIVDPFHTLFGVAALSLLGDTSVEPINPIFCMPEYVIARAGVKVPYHIS